MGVAIAHRDPLLRECRYVEIAHAALGEPRTRCAQRAARQAEFSGISIF